MAKKRGRGGMQWGHNRLAIDKPGFWRTLTDEELRLLRTKLRDRLTEKQQQRADDEAEKRAERKKAKKPKPKRRRKSPQRFVGEGEFNRYGKRIGEGELTVGKRRAGWHEAKKIAGGGQHSHSYRVQLTRTNRDQPGQIVRKCRCGRTEQWLGGRWELLDEGRR